MEVLEPVQQKLKGWKARCLSFATRTTLIKAVTSAIPSYVMQTASIPWNICDKIDKCQWSFLWGSTTEQRRLHKVKWEVVCKTKTAGGLGIRKMKVFNNAMLAKLSWRVARGDKNLSIQVLKNKYMLGGRNGQLLALRSSSNSTLWKGIVQQSNWIS